MNGIFIVFVYRYFFDILQYFIEQITEIHKIDCRNTDGIPQAKAIELINVNFLFHTVDFVDSQNDRFS